MISCLVLDNVGIYCIITFYYLAFYKFIIQIYVNFLILLLISGEEPYHGCTDIKPSLLLLLLNQ